MTARFIMSAPRVGQMPACDMPEFAFIGRSNVGKSSLVGTLIGQPDLVRTSRTPGRTQLLNLFIWDERLAIVDLPGYGYAQMPPAERVRMQQMVQEYIAARNGLSGVVLLLDARREVVAKHDIEVAQLILQHDRPLIVVITKIDLIVKSRRIHAMQTIQKSLKDALGTSIDNAIACSAKLADGQALLRRRLWDLHKIS